MVLEKTLVNAENGDGQVGDLDNDEEIEKFWANQVVKVNLITKRMGNKDYMPKDICSWLIHRHLLSQLI